MDTRNFLYTFLILIASFSWALLFVISYYAGLVIFIVFLVISIILVYPHKAFMKYVNNQEYSSGEKFD